MFRVFSGNKIFMSLLFGPNDIYFQLFKVSDHLEDCRGHHKVDADVPRV